VLRPGTPRRPPGQLGYQVAGLDLSRPLLARAAALAVGQGRRVALVQADMRRLPFAGASFDAVLNLFNAFGYLEDDAQSDVTRTGDGLVVLQERTLNLRSGRERVRYTLLDPHGHRTTREHAMRLYALTELEAMLGRAGLELLAVHGDLDGGPLELDSSFLVT
jgi:SAM-dependent methyltransferase